MNNLFSNSSESLQSYYNACRLPIPLSAEQAAEGVILNGKKKKSVHFNEVCRVFRTYAKEDYDRRPFVMEGSSMSRQKRAAPSDAMDDDSDDGDGGAGGESGDVADPDPDPAPRIRNRCVVVAGSADDNICNPPNGTSPSCEAHASCADQQNGPMSYVQSPQRKRLRIRVIHISTVKSVANNVSNQLESQLPTSHQINVSSLLMPHQLLKQAQPGAICKLPVLTPCLTPTAAATMLGTVTLTATVTASLARHMTSAAAIDAAAMSLPMSMSLPIALPVSLSSLSSLV